MRLFWQLIALSAVAMWADSALAQRRPIADDTLGNERTIVRPQNNIRGLPGDRIQGGARRGANLFHSFREFNVDAGRAVYFDDPGVRNILSRITGGNASEILGRLGVLGDANLFLINPNGIIFGKGASLDVRGSFVSTTANAIQFGNQGFFNVSDPNAPPLLTIQPSALLFNQMRAAPIVNQSIAAAGQNSAGLNVFGLRVPNGQSLLLVGGNVSVDGGRLNAPGGRVELGGLSEPGAVLLNADGSLGFPIGVERSDVLLTNGALIDVAAGSSGNIAVNARNLNVSGRSSLQAGITSSLGTVNSQAGDIVLNATGEIQVGQSSSIVNNVGANGIGNSGKLDIMAGSLFVTGGASLQAITRGQGNAGNVIINANDQVVFDGGNAFSTVEAGGAGRGGNVEINTGSLEVRNGAQLQASTFGRGDAGNVLIGANRAVFDGTGSAAFSTVGSVNFNGRPEGRGGDVRINADSLEVRNGAALVASTYGQGDAGNVIIQADNRAVFDGAGSAAFSTVGAVSFNGRAEGKGGDVRISADSLEVRNGGQLQASTFGQGDAGNVLIGANRAVFDGTSANGARPSAAFSRVEGTGVGNGGDIRINTDSLEVRNGAQLQASTFGQGDAGNVLIGANRAVFDGTDSAAFSRVEGTGVGNGGDISINANSLEVRNGARLSASTRGQGDAGNVLIGANRAVFDGGNAFSTVGDVNFNGRPEGRGGDVRISADSLEVRNGARLSASTFGQGAAGDVLIGANRVVFDGTGSTAFSRVEGTGVGNGGDININTGSLEVRNGAQLQASTFGQGDAGNVLIGANRAMFDGTGSAAFSRVEGTGVGNGGDIRINTGSLEVTHGAALVASSRGQGNAGNIIIQAGNRAVFNGTGSAAFSSVEAQGTGKGGNITIATGSLIFRNGAQLTASTAGRGNAGNIRINADTASLTGVGSDGRSSGLYALTSRGANGQGGNIIVHADSIRLTDSAVINAQTFNAFRGGDITLNADTFEATGGGQVITTTLDRGRAGNINLNVADRATLSGFDPGYHERRRQHSTIVSNQGAASGLFANTARRSSGRGGTIRLTTGELDVFDRARVVVNSRGSGDAGNINISAQSVQLNRGRLTAETGRENGGNITLRDLSLLQLQNNSLISATAGTDSGRGNGGNVNIDANFIVSSPDENSDIRANAFEGNGGTINIDTQGVFGLESREAQTDFSDITASSEQGAQGTVSIDQPDADPRRGLTELPVEVVDASDQIAQTCPSDGNPEALGEFVITGRGGLPPDPAEIFGGEVVLSQLASLENGINRSENRRINRESSANDRRLSSVSTPPSASRGDRSSSPSSLVEAQGWVTDSNGKVMLVAETSAIEPHNSTFGSLHCSSSN